MPPERFKDCRSLRLFVGVMCVQTAAMFLLYVVMPSHPVAVILPPSPIVAGHRNNQADQHSKIHIDSSTGSDDTVSTRAGNYPYVDVPLNIPNVNSSGGTNNKLKILWFNPPDWIQEWNDLVDFSDCPYSNCRLVRSKESFSTSDAVIFSIDEKSFGSKPPVPPRKRNPNQVWTFFSLESPVHKYYPNDYKSPLWRDVFNWSWSYRQDADIFQPYGILETKPEIPTRNYTQVFKRKTGFAAWLVSHCDTHSQRGDYVKMLQKYIPVDIFGKCGRQNVKDVEELVNTKYKFYLGFENSLCNNYITEKFFHYYKYDIVTVVRGKVLYNNLLPNGSFINTADFSTVKSLADFLIDLGSNETEYSKYLKIKDSYNVYERVFTYRNSMCEMCEKLNKLENNRNVYSDIAKWLGLCYRANDLQ